MGRKYLYSEQIKGEGILEMSGLFSFNMMAMRGTMAITVKFVTFQVTYWQAKLSVSPTPCSSIFAKCFESYRWKELLCRKRIKALRLLRARKERNSTSVHYAAIIREIPWLAFPGQVSNPTCPFLIEISVSHDGQRRGHLLSHLSIPLYLHPHYSGPSHYYDSPRAWWSHVYSSWRDLFKKQIRSWQIPAWDFRCPSNKSTCLVVLSQAAPCGLPSASHPPPSLPPCLAPCIPVIPGSLLGSQAYQTPANLRDSVQMFPFSGTFPIHSHHSYSPPRSLLFFSSNHKSCLRGSLPRSPRLDKVSSF